MQPNHLRSYERDLADDQPVAEDRPKLHAQLKALGLQEIAAGLPGLLRNRDAVEFQSAPGGDADLAKLQRSIQPLAEFLLNPMMNALRLDI